MLSLDIKNIFDVVSRSDLEACAGKLDKAHESLAKGTGAGGEFTGWLRLPESYLQGKELPRVIQAAEKIRSNSEALVVIGIGGSYLGTRAAVELLQRPGSGGPDIYYLGTDFSQNNIGDVIKCIEDRDFSINVISKSGTTLETSVSFRIMKKLLEERYGEKKAAGRIYATTDPKSGALRQMADEAGYEAFAVPGDIGGRYSVLSAVGLLPIAAAGIDITELLNGAKNAMERYDRRGMENPAWQYAAARNLLYKRGRKIEILAYYEPSFRFASEWWKQLFGESEGKGGKGVFPASAQFPADLHSLGQYIQDGERSLFETAVYFRKARWSINVPPQPDNLDGLSYLEGVNLGHIERQAMLASLLAHADGGVPNMRLEAEAADAESLGELFYFFMISCALSGYMLGVNPFDQPGVEAYKKNTFALLGKPGFEDLREDIERRLERQGDL